MKLRTGLLLLPLLLAALLLPAGCGGPAWDGPPILVFGMDGLEWSVLEPLMAAGRAPNFARLVERGVGGSLQTMIPTFSPVVWTTIATGAPPEEHGILNFGVWDPVKKEMGKPYTSNCRAVPAIWNLADDLGRSVLSVAWWVSWPAEAVEHGRIVASYAAQVQGRLLWKSGVWERGLPEHTWPPELREQILPALADGRDGGPLTEQFIARFGRIRPGPALKFRRHLAGLFHVAFRGDATHVRIMREQLERQVADLNLVYIGLPDVAGHFYWRYREPERFLHKPDPALVAELGGHIDRAYEQADAWLGEVLAAVPEETIVLVLSDHGMHAFNTETPESLEQGGLQSGGHEDAPDGVLIAAGPGVRRRGLLPAGERRLGGVLDVAPTLCDLLGIELPAAARGASLRRVLMTDEWCAAHPEPGRRDYRRGFRPPTPPREPYAGASQDFLEDLVKGLGYIDSVD
ncbi:MAG: hypothetical protein D6702_03385 [Planctomycetota bacterium]|nr:MAG: hypothetical protein D6702_03385 [Planctomycetota bacterium]